MRVLLAALAIGAGVSGAGCSVIVDDAIQDRDAGAVESCTGVTNGTECGNGRVCVDEACAVSTCGDGVVDTARDEQCDDGNDERGDGCEPTSCIFTCSIDSDCADDEECDGEARCEEHRCVPGTDLDDGAECTLADVPDVDAGMPDAGIEDAGVDFDGGTDDPTIGQCRAGVCVSRGCGNGVLGEGEECDDGNSEDGDGCDTDCTYSCENDAECQNETVCDGTETCEVATHTCSAGDALDCADAENFTNGRGDWGPDCTVDTCDPLMGCVHTLRDADADGYPPSAYVLDGTSYSCLGTAANDCNDVDETVYPGAEEICDGRDNNCVGGADETAPTHYADCDGDGFAALNPTTAPMVCTPPANTGCPNPAIARWTTTRPIAGNRTTYDCNDANPSVFPGQETWFASAIPGAPALSAYDYNCDGTNQQERPDPPPCTTPPCFVIIPCINGRCYRDFGWSDNTAPACGAQENYDYCVNGRTSCGTNTQLYRQRCR
ncbi:MopE-related protein [Sandaracinus amylolyticus]|uniref:MopE-related protein n=1 Tax=Sandaracinus amylolyticus TaxID=927083 RepID=UPI001F34002B|nr:MopE-related protein [Sandaracinus amylolyticus]